MNLFQRIHSLCRHIKVKVACLITAILLFFTFFSGILSALEDTLYIFGKAYSLFLGFRYLGLVLFVFFTFFTIFTFLFLDVSSDCRYNRLLSSYLSLIVILAQQAS